MGTTLLAEPLRRSQPVTLPRSAPLSRSELAREARRRLARLRIRRADRIIGTSSLAAAALALPIGSASPEAASVLAVAAMALLAGQRWALGVVIVAELALIAALWPAALGPAGWSSAAAWVGLAAALPGIIAMKRGAAALALLAVERRTRATCRVIHGLLLMLAMLCGCSPLL
jgi:hypothetical protein